MIEMTPFKKSEMDIVLFATRVSVGLAILRYLRERKKVPVDRAALINDIRHDAIIESDVDELKRIIQAKLSKIRTGGFWIFRTGRSKLRKYLLSAIDVDAEKLMVDVDFVNLLPRIKGSPEVLLEDEGCSSLQFENELDRLRWALERKDKEFRRVSVEFQTLSRSHSELELENSELKEENQRLRKELSVRAGIDDHSPSTSFTGSFASFKC